MPSIEEPLKIVNNPISNENKKRYEEKLNGLDAIENQIIKYIAEDKNIIIDEFDLYTLITVISSILEDQNLLIFSENEIIGKIYEILQIRQPKLGYIPKILLAIQVIQI